MIQRKFKNPNIGTLTNQPNLKIKKFKNRKSKEEVLLKIRKGTVKMI